MIDVRVKKKNSQKLQRRKRVEKEGGEKR